MATPLRFLTGTALLILSIGAFAQDPVQTTSDEESAEDPKVLAPIQVTGYHIKRMDIEGPAPVMVFYREDFEQAGINTLQEFAQYLPINFPEPVRQDGAIGATAFDLRGIGVDATLTLVNGFRIAPYAQLAENAVDINSIPISAIERVEILKDGASAIYGADAVAGVVNIILRQGFNGVEVNAGYGKSQRGDGREMLADLVAGRDNGRGSIMFSLSWYDREPQAMRDRDWSNDVDFSSIGGPNRRSAYSSPPGFLDYNTFVAVADPECGTDPSVTSIGPSQWGAEFGEGCKYNYAWDTELLWGFERIGASLVGRYEIKSNLSLFGDLLFSQVEGRVNRAPSPITDSPLYPTYGGQYVPAEHPNNPFGAHGEVYSRPLDFGPRTHHNKSDAYRVLLGLEGTWAKWDWRLSGLVSNNTVKKDYLNMVSYSRYQLALWGEGGPNGALWYNPFGYQPQNDLELKDWLTSDAVSKDKSGERSVDLLFDRLFGSLPGGPMGVAVGFQYREQELEQWADDKLLSGDLGAAHDPVSADRNIFSAYAEFKLPILDSLEAQLAVRYERYSDFGSTTNPKIAIRWQPLTSLMFRGSFSTSFKPPSFYELYAPLEEDWNWYIDWVRCDYTGLAQDCEEQYFPGEYSGNPDLEPEKGKSWFVGTVWTPEFWPGFEFQLDFWKFRHEDRIEWPGGWLVLRQRGDLGIIREPTEPDGTPGRISLIRETFINTDELQTRGFDTTIRYSWQTKSAGDFRAGLMHTYIDQWAVTDSMNLGIQGVNYAGTYRWNIALPRNRFNLNFSWSKDPHGAAANIHYIGGYENSSNLYVDGQQTDAPMNISSHTTLDLQYSYRFEKLKNAVIRLGCNNVTDKDPPLTYSATNQPFHDPRGRFFYIRWQQPIR